MKERIKKNPRKAAIDTNVLLLVMCASLRRDPRKHKRLQRYTEIDIKIIEDLICSFEKLVTTPNILSEASNLINGHDEYKWLAEFISKASETYIPSIKASQDLLFPVLGLTDLCLLSRELQDCCIITDDQDLSCYLYSQERTVINYREHRETLFQSN